MDWFCCKHLQAIVNHGFSPTDQNAFPLQIYTSKQNSLQLLHHSSTIFPIHSSIIFPGSLHLLDGILTPLTPLKDMTSSLGMMNFLTVSGQIKHLSKTTDQMFIYCPLLIWNISIVDVPMYIRSIWSIKYIGLFSPIEPIYIYIYIYAPL